MDHEYSDSAIARIAIPRQNAIAIHVPGMAMLDALE